MIAVACLDALLSAAAAVYLIPSIVINSSVARAVDIVSVYIPCVPFVYVDGTLQVH